jgi:hypothetical protein
METRTIVAAMLEESGWMPRQAARAMPADAARNIHSESEETSARMALPK